MKEVDIVGKLKNRDVISLQIKEGEESSYPSKIHLLLGEEIDLNMEILHQLYHKCVFGKVCETKYLRSLKLTMKGIVDARIIYNFKAWEEVKKTKTEDVFYLIQYPEVFILSPIKQNKFMRELAILLERTNSIALIATNSPFILQEVSKECVNILYRYEEDNFISISKPSRETFGEGLISLSYDVFRSRWEDTGYYAYIQKKVTEDTGMDSESSFEAIKDKFGDSISNHALCIISQMLYDRKRSLDGK